MKSDIHIDPLALDRAIDYCRPKPHWYTINGLRRNRLKEWTNAVIDRYFDERVTQEDIAHEAMCDDPAFDAPDFHESNRRRYIKELVTRNSAKLLQLEGLEHDYALKLAKRKPGASEKRKSFASNRTGLPRIRGRNLFLDSADLVSRFQPGKSHR